jgi:hypothetical protein
MPRNGHHHPGVPTTARALLAVLVLATAACGGGADEATTSTTAATETTTSGSELDPTRLPVGDGKHSTTPQEGFVMTCQAEFPEDAPGAQEQGPWFNGDGTWDSTAKAVVDGEVEWPARLETEVVDGVRTFTGNDLPDHPTGEFPIGEDDDAARYDRNPNAIAEQVLAVEVPAEPEVADEPTCIGGEVGVVLTGAALFSAFDAGGRDAVAWETQDACSGHPQDHGAYHYHSLTSCLADPGDGRSTLLGYAYDGFGIYGPRGADGVELTNADLDECHGTTSEVMWEGELVEMYHYVATREFPYTVGCFRGTPLQTSFEG